MNAESPSKPPVPPGDPLPGERPAQRTTPPRHMTVPLFATPVSNYLWPDVEPLNRDLARLIRERQAATRGQQKSNVGGWHSAEDLFRWPEDSVRELSRRLQGYIAELIASVAIDPHADRDRFVMEGWANVLSHGHYHSVHNHPNATWSGVYYVNGNPPADGVHPFSGKLELLDPRPGASLRYTEGTHLYGRYLLNPTAGQMLVFPGWLQHQVHPYFGPGERITIAFNVITH